MRDYELDELKELSKRLDAKSTLREDEVKVKSRTGWSVTVEAPSIEHLNVRSTDRRRARLTLKSALIEQLGERGLLRPSELDDVQYGYGDAATHNQEVFEDLSGILEQGRAEEELQKCLGRHPDIWRFLVGTRPQVVDKMPLGQAFVTDFVVFGAVLWGQSETPTATFVEIERADAKLFTAKGDPTRELTHGLRQLRNWRQWIADHKQQVREHLLEKTHLSWERHGYEGRSAGVPAYGFADEYLLVIGRRGSMTPAQRWQLQQLSAELPKTNIVTYDLLLDVVCPEAPWPRWMVED